MSLRNSIFTFVYVVFLSNILMGQGVSRSGFPAPAEDLNSLRRFPCGGITILDEDIQGDSLPSGWVVEDLDGNTPNANINFLLPQGGWQVSKDLKDTTNGNFVFASPSWYEASNSSDDWLVSPQIASLPANTCLSWYAYSADQFFPESYQVWVSTSGNTSADFLNNGTLIESILGEGIEFTFRSISLADFAGESVYIGFRHISEDGFALAIDQVRLAEVEAVDMAIFAIDNIFAKVNETISISGSFINRGLDTLQVDSNAILNIYYSIDGQDTNRYAYPSAFALAPNDTLTFIHDSVWTPTENRVYRVKVWLDQVAGDNNPANDTLGFWQGIGTATNVEEEAFSGLRVYPNPASDKVVISFEDPLPKWEVVLFDLMGKKVQSFGSLSGHTTVLNLQTLKKGMYILRISSPKGLIKTEKLLLE